MIIGGLGNMGRRYKCILEQVMKIDVVTYDVDHGSLKDLADCSGVIIASPTHTHLSWIRRLGSHNKPILCEKPLTTNIGHLEAFENENRTLASQITMVNQYAYLVENHNHGATYYDYFKTGNDGLHWDCLNVIGMADKRPEYIDNKSPFWNCMIRGKKLSIEKMDFAYVSMIRDWIKEPKPNYAYAREAHYKVAKFMSGKW